RLTESIDGLDGARVESLDQKSGKVIVRHDLARQDVAALAKLFELARRALHGARKTAEALIATTRLRPVANDRAEALFATSATSCTGNVAHWEHRVDQGDCPPQPPTDPHVRDEHAQDTGDGPSQAVIFMPSRMFLRTGSTASLIA